MTRVGRPLKWASVIRSGQRSSQWWGQSPLDFVRRAHVRRTLYHGAKRNVRVEDRPRCTHPPVRGPVELFASANALRFWRSSDPAIAEEGRTYITFDQRPNLYGQCTEKNMGDVTRSCTIFWYDNGLLHCLWVPGTFIEAAPVIADEYKRIITVR